MDSENDAIRAMMKSLEESKTKEAVKHDQGKPSFTAIPQLALLDVATVFTHGESKYGKFNYSGEMPVLRYIDALQRHLNQYLTFVDKDDLDESGVHHLACVAANALMALDSIKTGKVIDNRNQVYNKEKKIQIKW